MPKPSNKDLLAERRAIRELLDVDDDVSTLDAVTALKMHRDELRDDVRRYANVPAAAIQHGPVDGPIIETKPSGVPVDTAIYPGFNDHIVPIAPLFSPPVMTAQQGDLTPAYCRWLLAEKGPAFVREKYPDRLHLLPEDVRRALV